MLLVSQAAENAGSWEVPPQTPDPGILTCLPEPSLSFKVLAKVLDWESLPGWQGTGKAKVWEGRKSSKRKGTLPFSHAVEPPCLSHIVPPPPKGMLVHIPPEAEKGKQEGQA